jgi:hypothetical protein
VTTDAELQAALMRRLNTRTSAARDVGKLSYGKFLP